MRERLVAPEDGLFTMIALVLRHPSPDGYHGARSGGLATRRRLSCQPEWHAQTRFVRVGSSRIEHRQTSLSVPPTHQTSLSVPPIESCVAAVGPSLVDDAHAGSASPTRGDATQKPMTLWMGLPRRKAGQQPARPLTINTRNSRRNHDVG